MPKKVGAAMVSLAGKLDDRTVPYTLPMKVVPQRRSGASYSYEFDAFAIHMPFSDLGLALLAGERAAIPSSDFRKCRVCVYSGTGAWKVAVVRFEGVL